MYRERCQAQMRAKLWACTHAVQQSLPELSLYMSCHC